jgi:dUTP pyrophosphatase
MPVLDLQLRVKRLRPEATLPRYATPGAAALDLYAAEDAVIAPGERRVVATGIGIELPDGWAALVKSRSGLCRQGLTVDFGLIDSDYRGDIGVQCVNVWRRQPGPTHDVYIPNEGCWEITAGDRIAQLLILPVGRASLVDVGDGELSGTERGTGGFGHTGVR